jgi:hypothetical protein
MSKNLAPATFLVDTGHWTKTLISRLHQGGGTLLPCQGIRYYKNYIYEVAPHAVNSKYSKAKYTIVIEYWVLGITESVFIYYKQFKIKKI